MLEVFFFFKQKTAYEMRISDWSSDVCSSDLAPPCTDDIPNNDGYMRPKGRVEGASHLVRTSRRRRDGLPSFPAHRFGLRIPKGNGDVAPHRDLLRISCECVEAETAGAEPNRLLQVGRQTGTPFRPILRHQPEMLLEDPLQTTTASCPPTLSARVGTRGRPPDHRT